MSDIRDSGFGSVLRSGLPGWDAYRATGRLGRLPEEHQAQEHDNDEQEKLPGRHDLDRMHGVVHE